jgi:isopentenyl-diphosphate Delta-isomerase
VLPYPLMEEKIVLVDEHDNPVGEMGKLEAHQQGLLHRAFSVFVFNSAGELLLQRRALGKYHSGGLWTNTCCSHQRSGESTLDAAHRRLREEMGFDCPLEEVHSFVYRAELDPGLTEHEYDHVLVGEWEGAPNPDPNEAMEWRWVAIPELRADIAAQPERYTYWLKFVLDEVLQKVGRG